MQILILNQFWMQILILKHFFIKNHKFESKNNKNLNFESIFIKNHKFESKNHKNLNFESIFIKNHKFESKNHENLNFDTIFTKNHKFWPKIMKIYDFYDFLWKIKKKTWKSCRVAARRRLKISRRSASPTEDFASQRVADWRFRVAARRGSNS